MKKRYALKKPKIILRFIDKKRKDFKLFSAKKTQWHNMCDEIQIRPYHNWCGYFKKTYNTPKKRTPCLNLWTTLAINSDADVSICSLDHAKEGIVGNIKRTHLEDIWNGQRLNTYRKKHLCNDYKNLKPCQGCTEWRHNIEFWKQNNATNKFIYATV